MILIEKMRITLMTMMMTPVKIIKMAWQQQQKQKQKLQHFSSMLDWPYHYVQLSSKWAIRSLLQKKTDNKTADGFVNGTIKQNKTKAAEMRFDWLKYRSAWLQFDIYWASGTKHFADFFTKKSLSRSPHSLTTNLSCTYLNWQAA